MNSKKGCDACTTFSVCFKWVSALYQSSGSLSHPPAKLVPAAPALVALAIVPLDTPLVCMVCVLAQIAPPCRQVIHQTVEAPDKGVALLQPNMIQLELDLTHGIPHTPPPADLCLLCHRGLVEIEAITCRIFRHGWILSQNKQLPPHASKEECENAIQIGLLGCGNPFELTQTKEGWVAIQCDFI